MNTREQIALTRQLIGHIDEALDLVAIVRQAVSTTIIRRADHERVIRRTWSATRRRQRGHR